MRRLSVDLELIVFERLEGVGCHSVIQLVCRLILRRVRNDESIIDIDFILEHLVQS